MATLEDGGDDRYLGVDVESILSRVENRPLTFHRKRSLNRAPEFVKRLTGEQTVDEGKDAHFDCKVDGFPKPSVRWFKEDQEVVDHPRIHWQVREDGSFTLTLEAVTKGDEAAYRCRAENVEGQTSCTFFLSVKGKPKNLRRAAGRAAGKRSVSYPPMFTTIVEKVEEEEKAAREAAKEPPSPLTELYNGTTLKQRGTWPNFLGEWAFKPDHSRHRTGSAGSVGSCGSLGSEADEDVFDVTSFPGGGGHHQHHDDVFAEEGGSGGEDEHPLPPSSSPSSRGRPPLNTNAPTPRRPAPPIPAAFYLGEEDDHQDVVRGEGGEGKKGDATQSCREGYEDVDSNASSRRKKPPPPPPQDADSKEGLREPMPLTRKDALNVYEEAASQEEKERKRSRGQKAEEGERRAGDQGGLTKEPNNNDAHLMAGCRATDAGKVYKSVTSSGPDSSKSATPPKSLQTTPPKSIQATPPKTLQTTPPKSVQATPPKTLQTTPSKSPRATPPKSRQATPPKSAGQTTTPPKSLQNNKTTTPSSVSAPASQIQATQSVGGGGQVSSNVLNNGQAAATATAPAPSGHAPPTRHAHHARPPKVIRRRLSGGGEEDGVKERSRVTLPEIMFLLCLWTFAALCLGVPSGKFVMLVLGVEVMYWVAYVFGVC